MLKTSSVDNPGTLISCLSKLAKWIPEKEVKSSAWLVLDLLVPVPWTDNLGAGHLLRRLLAAKELVTLASYLSPDDADELLTVVAQKIIYAASRTNWDYDLQLHTWPVSDAIERVAQQLSVQKQVEVLKDPLCVGEARRVVLDQLGRRYGRHFEDQWDFVRFAEEQKLGLDFTSPAQHP
jgi:hypothetical protein